MFDHHTHSLPCQSAIDAMRHALEQRGSRDDEQLLQEAIYRLVGAPSDALFQLTSAGAEAIQQVIWSAFVLKARKEGKTHFITSCIEDAPFLQMLKRCEELGCTIRIAPVDHRGRLDLPKLQELISPRTALISLSMAHGLTGVIQPYEEVARMASAKGVLLHLDASYLLGKVPLSFAELPADYLSFSGECIHSIPGSGGLFSKKGAPLLPYILRSGPDLAALAALSAAARLAALSLDAMSLEVARLRTFFEEELMQKVEGLQILFSQEARLPNTTALLFPGVHHEALTYFLARRGILANQSGYSTQKLQAVLATSGIETESALSFSFSRMTTEEEVVQGVERIAEAVSLLQQMSRGLSL